MSGGKALIPTAAVAQRILLLRGHRVMIDADLADMYGVETKVLNQAVKRNRDRFPDEFMFQLDESEKQKVVTSCDHLARLKYSPVLPYVFTEHDHAILDLVEAIKQLMSTPQSEGRPIGFTADISDRRGQP